MNFVALMLFSFIHIIFEQVLPLFSITLNSSHFYSTSRDINVGASNQSLDSLNLSDYFFYEYLGFDKTPNAC